jgi:hypothetical protein
MCGESREDRFTHACEACKKWLELVLEKSLFNRRIDETA